MEKKKIIPATPSLKDLARSFLNTFSSPKNMWTANGGKQGSIYVRSLPLDKKRIKKVIQTSR
jgi:hypothetical protein